MISVFDMASGELLHQELSKQRWVHDRGDARRKAPEADRQANRVERECSAELQLRLHPVESSGPVED